MKIRAEQIPLLRNFYNALKGKEGGIKARYMFLYRWMVIVTSIVAVTPLIILSYVNYYQYKNALEDEVKERVNHMTFSAKRSLEFFFSERRAALAFIANEHTSEELANQTNLVSIFQNFNDAVGGIVDMGFIDSGGRQVSYVGPHDLIGKDYSDQDWFHEVTLRGYYVSDVFLGYRNFPHFVIAVTKKGPDGKPSVLRATIDSSILVELIRISDVERFGDSFIVNKDGILQTPSTEHGKLLDKADVPVPPYSKNWVVLENTDGAGKKYMLGYAYVNASPFIVMFIKYPATSLTNWFNLQSSLWVFLIISILVILLIIMAGSLYLVLRIKEADTQRASVLHKIEYQNKMASLGRLAAGVAHEINNPLAIINEKAGMLNDMANLTEDFPRKEKTVELTKSILKSVERCSRITRRLLGFAKHIDVRIESIEMDSLMVDVMSFLEHEAKYKNTEIRLDIADDKIPAIESDRGQLEQVFLNLMNNSLNALSERGMKGEILISIRPENGNGVSVTIKDNGPGIKEEDLKHIFEPFFTTRTNGTGLGLSITYGIVEKLGGKIEVDSKVGVGTSFKVTLPTKRV